MKSIIISCLIIIGLTLPSTDLFSQEITAQSNIHQITEVPITSGGNLSENCFNRSGTLDITLGDDIVQLGITYQVLVYDCSNDEYMGGTTATVRGNKISVDISSNSQSGSNMDVCVDIIYTNENGTLSTHSFSINIPICS